MDHTNPAQEYLQNVIKEFEKLKELCDKARLQLSEEDYHFQPDAESNSIAVIMKHMAGNMISRWTDFLTSDGEKPNRNRDREFIDVFKTNDELISYWEKGWKCLFGTISNLKQDDLLKTVYIRSEPHKVIEAVNRQLSHYAYHTGQIVFLAKLIKFSAWKTLSIPGSRPEEFNKLKMNK